MRIGIDIRCLAEGKRTGVEEYTMRTLEYIFQHDNKNEYILFNNSLKGGRTGMDWERRYPNVTVQDFRFPNKLFNFSLWFFRWPKIDRLIGGVDIFFAPNIAFLSVSKDCKKILTIHDLSFERFPEMFSIKRRLWHFMVNPRWLCRDFDQIITVSESTRQDVIGLYGIDPKKVLVSWPPIGIGRFKDANLDEDARRRVKEKYHLKESFILYLGTIEPRKNIEGLIAAFESLKQEKHSATDLQLVIAGARGWKCETIYRRFEHSRQRENIVFTDFVDDEDKPCLYKLAKVFVYPSFFEGFGFPPLEAMASGVPVVTSNCSSLPEVVGDAAILIDPYRPHEIALAVQQLLEDEKLCQLYVQRGRKRIEQLETWNPDILEVFMKKDPVS